MNQSPVLWQLQDCILLLPEILADMNQYSKIKLCRVNCKLVLVFKDIYGYVYGLVKYSSE